MIRTEPNIPTRSVSEASVPTRRRGLTWLVVAVVAIVAAAALVWFYWMGTPNVSFDGDSVAYRGSTTFDAGVIDFNLDASNYDNENGVAFIVGRLFETHLTEDDLIEYAANNPADMIPPFLSQSSLKMRVVVQEEVEQGFGLSEGTWTVWANTNPSDTNVAHFAAMIEVK